MSGRGRRHHDRLAFWLPVVVVLALLVGGGVVYFLDRGDDPAAPAAPAAVPPPSGVVLPEVVPPAPVAVAASGAVAPRAVRRAVAAPLDDPALGPHVLMSVTTLDGAPVLTEGNGTVLPASTLKLLTAVAALDVLGPDRTFETTVVADGPRRVVLVGGGDPLLSASGLRRLATQTAAAMLADGTRAVRVGYDTSLFAGPSVCACWPATYVTDGVVSPIEPLWVDEGRDDSGFGRVDDPAATAALEFADLLERAGLEVRDVPTSTTASAAATEVASLESEPLVALVEHTLETSDNEAAEVLARQVGIATSGTGSFASGARAVLGAVEALGVPTTGAVVRDGSGLSREDRLSPRTLTVLLATAASVAHPDLRAVVTGLPVAGFTGSLEDRYETSDAGRGFVQAKTGTLTGVSGLAGILTDRTGAPLLFAVVADRVAVADTLDARAALDEVTSALAGCRCGAAGTVAP